MNLLLLEQTETTAPVTLKGRRAAHIRRVLKSQPGDHLEAGIIGQGLCRARVDGMSETTVSLSLGEISRVDPPLLHVGVAVPRPKALSRMVSAIASFGVAKLWLFNAWRVEKSYFSSPRLDPQRLSEDALLGCEQGKVVFLPEIRIIKSFREFVEDVVPEELPSDLPRTVFHPGTHGTLGASTEELLVFGPEGGFIQKELDSFSRANYRFADLGTGPLRTEVAVAAGLGQRALLNA